MIVFGSRGSDLALTQTGHVGSALQGRTGESFRVAVIETSGDRELATPLPLIGGKGLFTAELEAALRDGSIDVAVHSLKDLPVEDPEGLALGAVPTRVSAVDVLVCRADAIDESRGAVPLKEGARVGTSSPRRAGALRSAHPDLECASVRGNVPTRVDKVRRGDYDAVVLAAAGLDRLGLDLGDLVRVELPLDVCPPAPGQGALGVQCRRDDTRVRDLLARLHDQATARAVTAERSLLAALGGGCSMPLGVHVAAIEDGFEVHAVLFARDARPGAARTVARGRDLDWIMDGLAAELRPLVSEPLAGVEVAVVRARGGGTELESWLSVAGAQARRVDATLVEPIEVARPQLEACARHVLAFTSPRAVERFFAEVERHGVDVAPPKVFAVGRRTADALAAHGIEAEIPWAPGGGARLAEHVAASHLDPGVPILFPCAERCEPAFARDLAAAGREVIQLPVYRTVPREGAGSEPLPDVVVVCAPSGARALGDALRGRTLVALGETSARGLRELGFEPAATATGPTPAAVIAAISESSS